MNVQDNYQGIRKRINDVCEQIGRNPEDIKVIAVTKYVSIKRAKEAIDAGVYHLGENRDTGLTEKFNEIGNTATWHFIGSLQTRKVKNIIDKVEYIHSLDRLSLAQEINKRAQNPIKCFLQVNVSNEETKHGCSPENVIQLIQEFSELQNIQIVGLMTMAPYTNDRDLIRACFKELKNLQLKVKALQIPNVPCQELSMGMSNDYEIAIEEGATFIRLGTSLVGKESGGE